MLFGDEPALAMGQIALRETALEAKSSYPHAAKVLKENTYIDDICHSVHTVQEAEQLIADKDNVLSQGGFQVKRWLSNQPLRKEKEGQRETWVKPLQGATEEKIIGTTLNHAEDAFMFKLNPPEEISLPSEEH